MSFNVPKRYELRYARAILKLITSEIPEELTPQNIDIWIDKFSEISENEYFEKSAELIARAMVRDINIHNVFNWRESSRTIAGAARFARSAQESSKGAINQAILDQIRLSKELISELPDKIASLLASEVETARANDNTEEGIYHLISRRLSPLLVYRATLLARTDPHRANSAMTKARSEDFDLPLFIWKTAKDSYVRYSHKRMEDVVVFWDDLPSPEALVGLPSSLGNYAPGDCPNCRCGAFPVFSVQQLFENTPRIRLYREGAIHSITQSQLLRLLS